MRFDHARLNHLNDTLGVDAADLANLLQAVSAGFVYDFPDDEFGLFRHFIKLRVFRVG